MTNKISKKLINIRGTIVGLKMELALLEQDLNKIEVDLFYLDKLQRDLVYNIQILKRDDVISVITEYRKSLEVLKEVRRKILKFRFMRQNLQDTIDKKMKQYDYYFEQLQNTNKVLPFKGAK